MFSLSEFLQLPFQKYLWYLLANTVFSIILVSSISFILKRYFSRRKTFLMLLPFCIVVPVIAPMFTIFYAFFLYLLASRHRHADFSYGAYPEFSNEKDEATTKHGEGGAFFRLKNKNLSSKDRLSSLISLNNRPSQSVNAVNESMLQDDDDEVRLYAYGMLSKQENRLYNDIHNLEERLEDCKNKSKQFILFKELCYKYWDLIYMNLAHDDIKSYALEKVREYLNSAMTIKKTDVALNILYGRLELFHKDYEKATSYFEKALELNAPDNKVIPYLTEIFFRERDLEKVSEYFKRAPNLRFMPVISGCAQFWEGK